MQKSAVGSKRGLDLGGKAAVQMLDCNAFIH